MSERSDSGSLLSLHRLIDNAQYGLTKRSNNLFFETLRAIAHLVCPTTAEASLTQSLVCENTVPPSHTTLDLILLELCDLCVSSEAGGEA